MNIRDIKMKARSVLVNQKNIFYVFIFISIITTLVNYAGASFGAAMIPFISLIISIIMLPFSHGNVVASLMVVNERGDEIDIENVGLTGFKRFKQLFFTYFIQYVFLLVIVLFIGLIMLLITKLTVDTDVFNEFSNLLLAEGMYASDFNGIVNDPIFNDAVTSLGSIIVIGTLIIAIAALMYSLVFALTPYILEKYKITGIKAMSESARMMKGYKKTLFILNLSYLGWIILIYIVALILQMLIPVPLVVELLVALASAYLYAVELQTCTAVLFEEIDLEDKNLI
ncbi:DUF975 family protein [Thomasclavelia sp.]|uniref:DUF975 family protein n=1 Tax=Thomasclavelia sp. TaxID=3025757 RepID=UPI0026116646|nr:DUF975 family protein [Thomasclavelia sp.]